MSTLKVTHLQNENGTGPAMSIAVGGGVTFAGITTFHSAVKFPGGIEDGLQVSTGATISGSSGNIGINDTDPNFKLDVNGDIGIREGNNLVWHDASGTAAFRIRAQSDNILRFERASGNEPNLTIDDGKIGIGSTQPERKLDVVGSGGGGAVVRSKVTTNNGGYLVYEALNSSGTSVFSVTHNGRINLSENIVFASGQGLDFSATGDGSGTTTSELLDDYEEGTWTPSIASLTLGNGILTGHYTKIGNIVHLSFRLDGGSTTSFSGSMTGIAGFPFTAALASNSGYLTASNPSNNWFGFTTMYAAAAATNYIQWDVGSTNNYVGSNSIPFTWGSSTIMRFNITYRTA